jgi:hypothetical protein
MYRVIPCSYAMGGSDASNISQDNLSQEDYVYIF